MKNWTRELADKDGKYGGGSAASVVGAFAASLAQFVFELQEGKEKYQGKEKEIKDSIKKAEKLNEELLELAEIDADAFEPVLPIFKLPQNTEAEKIERRQKLDAALEKAAEPPLEIIEKMRAVTSLYAQLLDLKVRGTIMDDVVVGLHFTKAAIEGGKINCMVNINLIKDEATKSRLTEEVDSLYETTLEQVDGLRKEAEEILG